MFKITNINKSKVLIIMRQDEFNEQNNKYNN